MDGASSTLPVKTTKGLISENHGTQNGFKTISPIKESLLSGSSELTDAHNAPETIDMPQHTPRNLPDINLYQNKKSFGTGMMDFALLVTNVSQLMHIISKIDSSSTHMMYVSLTLVVISIILQIIVGIFLTVNCRYDVKDCEEICKADRLNNWITVLIFLITAVNVVIPSFGVPENGF